MIPLEVIEKLARDAYKEWRDENRYNDEKGYEYIEGFKGAFDIIIHIMNAKFHD